MGKRRTLDELDTEWLGFTFRMPSSEALDTHIRAFTAALAEYPLPNGEGHLRPQQILPAFFEAAKGGRDTFTYQDFLESLAEKGLPSPEYATPYEISLKKGESITLSTENLTTFHELLEPFIRSFAADLLLQQQRQAISAPNKGANQFLDRVWNQYKEQISADAPLRSHADGLENLMEAKHLRPQDAFSLAAQILNRADSQVSGVKHELNYLGVLALAGKKGSLPTIGLEEIKRQFPKGLPQTTKDGKGTTLSPEEIHKIYNTAAALAPTYQHMRIAPLKAASEQDVQAATAALEANAEEAAPSQTETRPPIEVATGVVAEAIRPRGSEETAAEEPSSSASAEKELEQGAETSSSEGKGSAKKPEAEQENSTTPKQGKKLLFDTTKSKITVAAVAVAAISMVLALLLGGKSKQAQQAAAR